MKDSGIEWIGVIPEDWEVQKFKNLFQIKKNIAGTLGYDILSVTQRGIRVKDTTKNEGQLSQDYSKYQIVDPDDFVMNHMDLLTGYVDCSTQLGVTSPDYRTFKAINNSISVNEYYLKIFQFCYSDAIFYRLGQGVSNFGRWRLPANQQNLFSLPLPTLQEQQAIANFLDVKCGEIDELIALQKQMIEELKLYKQSVITEAVTKGLNPKASIKDSGIEWIGDIPEHWEIVRLKNVSSKFSNGTTETQIPNEKTDYMVSRIESISTGTINYNRVGYIQLFESIDRYKLQQNDILISHINSYERVGNCAIYDGSQILYHGMNLIRISPLENVVPYYLLHILKTEIFIGQMQKNCKPAINQVSVPTSIIKQIYLAYPPIQEQQQIADYLNKKCAKIDELTSIKQQKINELKEYKKSIIYEYVTGKKQVNLN